MATSVWGDSVATAVVDASSVDNAPSLAQIIQEQQETSHVEHVLTQEEQDIERAIQESLRAGDASTTPTSSPATLSSTGNEVVNDDDDDELARAIAASLAESNLPTVAETLGDPVDQDFLLARQVQEEYDQELAQTWRESAAKDMNSASKVSTTLFNSTYAEASGPKRFSAYGDYSDEEFDVDEPDFQEVDTSWNSQRRRLGREAVPFGSLTKHDPEVCGRRNAASIEKHFELAGPMIRNDVKLSNAVYNRLRRDMRHVSKSRVRVRDKDNRSTTAGVLDSRTRVLAQKFIVSGLIERLDGAISTGKEAHIFHAVQLGDPDAPPSADAEEKSVAVKIFHTTLNEFNDRRYYLDGDPRYTKNLNGLKIRRLVNIWAEREFSNLHKLHRNGVLCPKPMFVREHVLLMQYLGRKGVPAPKLGEARLGIERMHEVYVDVVRAMRRMYQKCKLVHGDLSEYNLLYFRKKVWVIDVSQSVPVTHQHAEELLRRDASSITSFFRKNGVTSAMPVDVLCDFVTRSDLDESEASELEMLEEIESELLLNPRALAEFEEDDADTDVEAANVSDTSDDTPTPTAPPVVPDSE